VGPPLVVDEFVGSEEGLDKPVGFRPVPEKGGHIFRLVDPFQILPG
jgi:hypothetical protein